MENRRTVFSFFSWKTMLLMTLAFFVLTMLFEYLFDRKDYADIETLFRENAIRKAVIAVVFGAVTAYFRAKSLHRNYESDAK